jgi:hypothetical protein
MAEKVLQCGEAEYFKATVHLGLFGLAIAAGLYNLMAWTQRREGHLLKNVGVYSALVVYEAAQIRRHLQ